MPPNKKAQKADSKQDDAKDDAHDGAGRLAVCVSCAGFLMLTVCRVCFVQRV